MGRVRRWYGRETGERSFDDSDDDVVFCFASVFGEPSVVQVVCRRERNVFFLSF